MDRIIGKARALWLLGLMILLPAAADAFQASITCRGRLSVEDLVTLLKGGAADVQVQGFVNQCGISFRVTPEVERTLSASGASQSAIAAARKKDAEQQAREEAKNWDGIDLAAFTWTDPGTRLMWSLGDNGKAVNWSEAATFCRQLRFGGFADWRLPEIGELAGIYDASSRQLYKVKGNIQLSDPWAWSAAKDGPASTRYFYFGDRRRNAGPDAPRFGGVALCVRRSGKFEGR